MAEIQGILIYSEKHYTHSSVFYLVFHALVETESLVESIDGPDILLHSVESNFPAHHVVHPIGEVSHGVCNSIHLRKSFNRISMAVDVIYAIKFTLVNTCGDVSPTNVHQAILYTSMIKTFLLIKC